MGRRSVKSTTALLSTMIVLTTILVVGAAGVAQGAELSLTEQLGKALFFDTDLSNPPGQSCAACHEPSVGWTGPDDEINAAGGVYEGAVPGRFGNRKPPASAYAGDSPVLYYDDVDGVWVGGMFWDGRATGWTLGDPLAEQAQGPFLNPLEQHNASAQAVIDLVAASDYADLYQDVYGIPIANEDVSAAYERIARAIAAYERSSEVSPFTSRYDSWVVTGRGLTGQERNGLALFMGKAKCGNCHVPPLFTDFTYDNLGMPRNPVNPFCWQPDWNPLGEAWVDLGLGEFLQYAGYDEDVFESELGKQKVPTLRNVDKRPYRTFVKAYGHNGYFKSLEAVVHFYNTRDVPGAGWPEPEVAMNVNTTEMGDLGLNRGEEKAIVAFLRTLTDQ